MDMNLLKIESNNYFDLSMIELLPFYIESTMLIFMYFL